VKRKAPRQVALEVLAARRTGSLHAASLDISNCYEAIPHRHCLHAVEELDGRTGLIRNVASFLSTPHIAMNGDLLSATVKGLHPGTSPSNILAEMVLAPVDRAFLGEPVQYFRYVDDILLLGRTEAATKDGQALLLRLLGEFELEARTKHACPPMLFEHLGFRHYRRHGRPEMKVSASRVKKFQGNMRSLFPDRETADRRAARFAAIACGASSWS